MIQAMSVIPSFDVLEYGMNSRCHTDTKGQETFLEFLNVFFISCKIYSDLHDCLNDSQVSILQGYDTENQNTFALQVQANSL